MALLLIGDLDTDARAAWRGHLARAMPGETVCDDADAVDPEGVDIAIVANPPPGSLQCWPALRLIQSLWAGVDRLLADPTLPAGVPIARLVDPAMNAAMAETALWAVLSLQRGFFGYARQQRDAVWRQHPQRRADETTVAVLGMGQMGGTVTQRLAGLGYRVRGWRLGEPRTGGPRRDDRHWGEPGEHRGQAQTHAGSTAVPVLSGPADLPGLIATSDIVINLLPLTPATRGLLDAGFFAQMPAGAALVNLARGAHVVDADLLAALDSGHITHAVLDVFHAEPLPADHRYWRHPCVTVLPHVAAQTDPRSAAQAVAANVAALRAGLPLANLVARGAGY